MHSHDHGHSHSAARFGRAFAVGITLNSGLVLAQVVFGLLAHSLSLLADAGHNLGDVLGLMLAWGAARLATRAPSRRHTYGMRRSSILAALLNAALLLIATGAIAWEAVHRLQAPHPVGGKIVIVVALAGVAVNGLSALLFLKGRSEDLNIRSAFLHLVADAGVSLAVAIAGLGILWTGWLWLDPVMSLMIAAVIAYGTWGLFRESLDMALDAVPAGIDPAAIDTFLRGVAGVTSVHDLHIWPMSTCETALTAHLIVPEGDFGDDAIASVCRMLHDRFGIEHSTLQIERGNGVAPCDRERASV
jgi:cobalt-zinc-cadmium efflux system protein